MKNVIASVSLVALGAITMQAAPADLSVGTDKPWTISGTLRGFYDDNYNAVNESQGRTGSAGFEVRPSAAINLNLGPTTISASYLYSMKYYVDRPGTKYDQDHDIELFLNHNFNERYSADLEDSFVIAQEPEILDPSLSIPRRANGDNLRNTISGNFHGQLTELFGFVVGYANTFYDYTGTPSSVGGVSYGTELNRFEHLITLNSRWTLNPESIFIAGYQFSAIGYLSQGSIAPGGTPYQSPAIRNNYSHYGYVGLDQKINADLTFSGRVGVQAVDYYNSTATSSAGGSFSPFADLSLSYTYADGGSATLGFRQSHNQTDVAYDVTTGTITQDQQSSTVYASLSQRLDFLSPRLIGSLTGQFQNSIYNGGGFNNEDDKFYLAGVNFSYEFNKYLSTELGYNYDWLQSDIIGRGYYRNRVYIGVTATY